jgi:DNA-binding protein HU-beta
MNKQEVIKAVAGKTELTQVAVTKMLNALEEVIYESVARNEKVQLTGLLTVSAVARAARKGYDPLKKVPLDINPTVGVKVKAGEKLRKAVEGLTYEEVAKASDADSAE